MLSYFIVLLLCGLSLGDVCPPADKLSPCTCDERQQSISCQNIRGRFDIKSVFDRVSPFIPESTIFKSLEIFGTSLLELPENSIRSLKFISIDLSSNLNLEYIHPNAFNSTYSITTNLSVWNNYINNDSPVERDIYQFFNNFKNIESIWIPGNLLSSVPENAFDSLPKLEDLYLGSNAIKKIGGYAFAKLTNLKKLYLSSNNISPDGLSPDAFDSISNSAIVDFTYNSYQFLDETHFKPLLDDAVSISVGGHFCSRNGCTYRRLICDSRADWICEDIDKYKSKLFGFLCTETYSDVWGYCDKQIT